MRRIPIRVKVAGSLALPLIALVAVSAFEVKKAADEASHVRQETRLATSVAGPAGVITTVQVERNWASLEMTGLQDSAPDSMPVTGYEPTRQQTDEAIRVFREDVESKGGAVERTFRGALDALGELQNIRRDIDNFSAPRSTENMPESSQIYDRYSELIGGLLEANGRITGQVRDAELRRGVELTVLATQQVEQAANLARQSATAALMSPGGLDTTDEMALISALLSAYDRTNEQMQTATGRYGAVVEAHFPRELTEQFHALMVQALRTGSVGDIGSFMQVVGVPPEEDFPGLRDALSAEVTEHADQLSDAAANRQRLFVLMAFLVLAVAATLSWLVSRSITRPLRSLTRQAREMAEGRLPGAVRHILDTPPGEDVRIAPVEPVEVPTRDEVADVVGAINTVQESALKLAVEQAVLRRNIAESFVSLGRRNQNLLGRQLDFITELETNETDPDTLSGLFRLDHLATRMRRNAESLLVLAGVEPPRKWGAPVPVTDVIRAALGEVEDYQRVTVDSVDMALVQGSVAADLAHLLAELVENALTFSPPDERVMFHGWWRGREGYRLMIVDQGVGMSPSAISQANARLAGSEPLTVAPSKFLGHHVAGNLAARHGILIGLSPGAMRGLVTTVDLPPQLAQAPAAGEVPDELGSAPAGGAGGADGGWASVGAGAGSGSGVGGADGGWVSVGADAGAGFGQGPGEGGWAAALSAAAGTSGPGDGSGSAAGRSGTEPAPWAEPPPLPPELASQPITAMTPPGGIAALRSLGTPLPSSGSPALANPGALLPDFPPAGPDLGPASLGRPVTPPGGTALPGRRTDPAAPGPTARLTAGGLPMRGRTTPADPTREAPAVPGHLLAALETHTRGAGRAAAPIASPVPEMPAPIGPPSGSVPSVPPDAIAPSDLPRRIRGAQLPTPQPMPLRRYQPPGAAPRATMGRTDERAAHSDQPVREEGGGRAGGTTRANEVYSFLSGFSAGVQRGLDEMRRNEGES